MSDVVLRYEARAENGVIEDQQRTFIICFYMRDDEIAVFEQTVRNSGFWGGKFSAKGRKVNPETGERFVQADFHVGARVTIGSMPFFITRADEYALKYMEANPDIYAQCDMRKITKKLAGLENSSLAPQSALLPDDFQDACKQYLGTELTEQELVTVLRACGNDQAQIQVDRVFEAIKGTPSQ